MQAGASQSAFDPAGANAALIDRLSSVLYIGAALIFAIVMTLAVVAVFRRASRVRTRAWVLGGGVAIPAVVLTALLAYALTVGNALSDEGPDCGTIIHVNGKRWWWEVRYEQPAGAIVSANELHLPVGRTVKLLLASDDVIHSFWVPALSGKVDMIPGRVNHLMLKADRPGVYRAQCAEFCGAQHAFMAMLVVVHEEGEYERWLEREARPARSSADTQARRGAADFTSAGCAACHTVRGTSAAGRLGPDLTHVASRLTLGAGVLDNNRASLAGWISNSQAVKPGNLMPPIKVPVDTLHGITAYVAGLE
jgi:cytochrome c oxidase subunit 2